MKKVFYALLAVVTAVSVLFSSHLYLGSNTAAFISDDTEYTDELTAIYQKYDGDIDRADKNDSLALNRLMVNDYNGKRYGCVARAWDKKNGFAVLQYQTRKDAESALQQIRADGLAAEGDSLAELDDSAVGHYNPEICESLGTPQYIGKINMNREDVVVGVIDTGVMYDHVFLKNRMYSNGLDLSADKASDAYYDTEQGTQYYYHGTFVCGIIAENTPQNVRIQPYKVVAFDADSATSSAIVTAVNKAVEQGVDCINISLHTTGGKTSINRAVDNAVKHHICVCVSAGNKSSYIQNVYPACSPGAIVVSALEKTEGSEQYTQASFSNYGDEVDFAAPGRKVYSAYPYQGQSMKHYSSGTSFSAPMLTACCADIKSINKDLTRDEVYDTIKDFATDMGARGKDDIYGWGMPNLSDIVYSDAVHYTYRIPEGALEIHQSADYTAASQPWKAFADKLVSATVDDGVTAIGNYTFYRMSSASFTLQQAYESVGDYAFAGCSQLSSYFFDTDVKSVGVGAFADIEGFVLNGYRNTPAEDYALSEGVAFHALGCKHHYAYESFAPTETQEGYTVYTCTVCGDSYDGAYVPYTPVSFGQCGENLTYTLYNSGRLVIDGTGDMYDYLNETPPWYEYRDSIALLQLNAQVEEISPFAFYGCNAIAKIQVAEGNAYYLKDDACLSLITKADGRLLLTCARGEYTLPDTVTSLSAPAFFCVKGLSLTGNEHFDIRNKLIYDSNGNIVAALPQYRDSTLTLSQNVSIQSYAFILAQCPAVFDTEQLTVTIAPYGIGYRYQDCNMQRQDLTFKVYEASTAYQYAAENGFTVNGYDVGKCGEAMMWHYDNNAKKLTLTGTGEMEVYASVSEVPWHSYLSNLTAVEIGNDVKSISPYAFYGTNNVTSLTLPFSVNAFDATAWYGCQNLDSVTFTCGSGVSDDYGAQNGVLPYQFTPWYLSREMISACTIPDGVKHIGNAMFCGAAYLQSLELNAVESIGNRAFENCTGLVNVSLPETVTHIGRKAFYNCPSLEALTVNAIACDIHDGADTIAESAVIYGCSGSTAHYYALRNSREFVSIGTCDCQRHYPLTDKGVKPTCTKGGLSDGAHCAICGEVIALQEPLEALGHTAVIDKAVPATFKKAGKTQGRHCKVCGKVLTAQKTVPKLKGAALTKIAGGKKRFKAVWSPVKSIDGYQLQYGVKKNFKRAATVTVKGASKKAVTVKKLKGKTKYYVRIRAYKTINGKKHYSAWSKAKAVKTK